MLSNGGQDGGEAVEMGLSEGRMGQGQKGRAGEGRGGRQGEGERGNGGGRGEK